MSSAKLTVTPSCALIDEPIHIVVTGLLPWQPVTVSALIISAKCRSFISHAFYVSDGEGGLNLEQSASHGGSYKGVERMGLFWSMKSVMSGPEPSIGRRAMFEPLPFDISVYSGHRSLLSLDDVTSSADYKLTSAQVARVYKADNVAASPVTDGRVRGMLFIPPGDGPFAGVVDMHGANGGHEPLRGALLASRGFAVLALAYFDYEDLPVTPDLELEYFVEALDWLHLHPRVVKTGIGVVGYCKGASMALEMAILSNKVKAIVSINGPATRIIGTIRYQGIELPTRNVCIEETELSGDGRIFRKAYTVRPEHNEFLIPNAFSCSVESQDYMPELRKMPGRRR